jgi:hypothetical protein
MHLVNRVAEDGEVTEQAFFLDQCPQTGQQPIQIPVDGAKQRPQIQQVRIRESQSGKQLLQFVALLVHFDAERWRRKGTVLNQRRIRPEANDLFGVVDELSEFLSSLDIH